MNSADLSKVFKDLVYNPRSLLVGKPTLDGYLQKTPNFLVEACRLFVFPSETLNFRKNVGVLLRVMIQDHWNNKELKLNFQKQKKVPLFSLFVYLKT